MSFITLKNRLLLTSNTSSPWGSLFISPTFIAAALAHVSDVEVGSSKKSFCNFSVIGLSKSAKYIVTPSILGSSNATMGILKREKIGKIRNYDIDFSRDLMMSKER